MNRAVAVVCALAGGCQAFSADAPALTSLTMNGLPAAICGLNSNPLAHGFSLTITGRGLLSLPSDALADPGQVGAPVAVLSGPASLALPVHALTGDRLEVFLADAPAPHPAGAYDLTVTLADGQALVLPHALTVHETPVIESVTLEGMPLEAPPTTICSNAPHRFTIRGQHLAAGGAPSISIGGRATFAARSVADETLVFDAAVIPSGERGLSMTSGPGCAALSGAGFVPAQALPPSITCTAAAFTASTTGPLDATANASLWLTATVPGSFTPTTPVRLSGKTLWAVLDAPPRGSVQARLWPGTVIEVSADGAARLALPLCGSDPACSDGVLPGGPYDLRFEQLTGSGTSTYGFSGALQVRSAPPVAVSGPPALSPAGTQSLALQWTGPVPQAPAASAVFAQEVFGYPGTPVAVSCPLNSTATATGLSLSWAGATGCTAADRFGRPAQVPAPPISLEGMRGLTVSAAGAASTSFASSVALHAPRARLNSSLYTYPQAAGGLLYLPQSNGCLTPAVADPLYGPLPTPAGCLGALTNGAGTGFLDDPSIGAWEIAVAPHLTNALVYSRSLSRRAAPPGLLASGGSPATGLAQFAVASVDAKGVESLPAVALAAAAGAISLRWDCDASASGYLVYRAAGLRTGWSKVATLPGAACPSAAYTYPAGSVATAAGAPVELGSLAPGTPLVSAGTLPLTDNITWMAATGPVLLVGATVYSPPTLYAATFGPQGTIVASQTSTAPSLSSSEALGLTAANGPVAAGHHFALVAGGSPNGHHLLTIYDADQTPLASRSIDYGFVSGVAWPGLLFADGKLWLYGAAYTLCASCTLSSLADFDLQPTGETGGAQGQAGPVLGRAKYGLDGVVEF